MPVAARATASASVTVEDELGRSIRGLGGIADGRVDLPPARGEPARRRLADPGRRAGYEDRRDAAISARCSRPYPSAPSSQSARL